MVGNLYFRARRGPAWRWLARAQDLRGAVLSWTHGGVARRLSPPADQVHFKRLRVESGGQAALEEITQLRERHSGVGPARRPSAVMVGPTFLGECDI